MREGVCRQVLKVLLTLYALRGQVNNVCLGSLFNCQGLEGALIHSN